ncbi:DUF5330 domain-containing protein [Ancylobacter pratisalsi]|uniref:DUF5330 domain-containing protein n=1 Tax=Ancylobacter pratisalsi TaxID=1745854 RepID=A0A6P1YQV8_9HYPH|nr:DUF5330 domain-containing protein [Ancylobacter pratisalsi]QIB35076.1 DUF5330 domain-containing protein [Ancylobacter pratisalsi]
MFFLLRIGFWLTLVFLLLPGIPGGPSHDGAQQAGTAKVDAVDALSAATSAMADAGGFCGRQPQACAIGAQIFDMIGQRAEAGARYALSYISEQISEQKRRAAARAMGSPAGDTLTTHDLAPEWQGPKRPMLDAASTGSISSPTLQPADAPPASTSVPRPPKRPA